MEKQQLINYVVNSYVRNELDINELLRLIHLLPDDLELNENQQIVLEWLKEAKNRSEWASPFGSLYGTIRDHELTIRRLSKEEQFQVLAAFAKWGLSHVEE